MSAMFFCVTEEEAKLLLRLTRERNTPKEVYPVLHRLEQTFEKHKRNKEKKA